MDSTTTNKAQCTFTNNICNICKGLELPAIPPPGTKCYYRDCNYKGSAIMQMNSRCQKYACWYHLSDYHCHTIH